MTDDELHLMEYSKYDLYRAGLLLSRPTRRFDLGINESKLSMFLSLVELVEDTGKCCGRGDPDAECGPKRRWNKTPAHPLQYFLQSKDCIACRIDTAIRDLHST